MNKKFAAVSLGLSLVILTMCSSAAIGKEINYSTNKTPQTNQTSDIFDVIKEKQIELTRIEQEALAYQKALDEQKAYQQKLKDNTKMINSNIKKIKKHVGKTPYVFSGINPYGWDCSGLVMWFYENMDIELYHSASVQTKSGERVYIPKPGDIVSFIFKGSKSSYHVGIYLSEDTMIHAGGASGDRTEIVSISRWAGKHSNVKYIRVIKSS